METKKLEKLPLTWFVTFSFQLIGTLPTTKRISGFLIFNLICICAVDVRRHERYEGPCD